MDFYVYILKCHDQSFYVGHTDNIDKRIAEHNNGTGSLYTRDRLPVALVFLQNFQNRDEALEAEFKIKRWTRKKKEALVKKDWGLLRGQSKKKFEPS